MIIDKKSLLERFLRYVKIDTMANSQASSYPSSDGQWELGKLLLAELREMGIEGAEQNEHGLVIATLPGNVTDAPVLVLNSHLDTSPEASGANVKPQVIESYDGTDIVLPGNPNQTITRQDNPELAELVGKTLITTDGTTLLGGDDKAGIAIIMEAIATLIRNQDLPHGTIRVLFTCDEEIGRGVQHVDVPALGGAVCYTLDGPGHGEVDVETFSADQANVLVRGRNIHPSIAKGRMVNSIRVLSDFLAALPSELAPETTEGREGFLHPYDAQATVEQSHVKILLRDFDVQGLQRQAELLKSLAVRIEAQHPGSKIEIDIVRQYRNLGDGLKQDPRAVEFATQAHKNLAKPHKLSIIRGGTDGSQLTELGLPTPNLSSGQHNAHSFREFACLDEMIDAVEIVVELARIWSKAG